MACIKVTPLQDPTSHQLMLEMGYVNRIGISTQSVWADPVGNQSEFFLKPDQKIHSPRQVVRLAFEMGLIQGAKNEQERLKSNLKRYADKFSYLVTNTNLLN